MHDQRRASRRRLQRVAAQLTAGSVVVKHEDGILKNKIKYTGLEENRSGDAAVATQGFGRVSAEQPEKFAPHQREEMPLAIDLIGALSFAQRRCASGRHRTGRTKCGR